MKVLVITLLILIAVGVMVVTVMQPFSEPAETQLQQQLEESEPVEPELVASERIDYSFNLGNLDITFDEGSRWMTVPVDRELLFSGEFEGNDNELIEHSYILNDERVAFIYVEGEDVRVVYSFDQGETWEDSLVDAGVISLRFRSVDFLSDEFGYVVLSRERTMSQEVTSVFVTRDGGSEWELVNSPDTTWMIADGGFVDEEVGFLSYGVLDPTEPDLYVTDDTGDTWSRADVHVPEEYDDIFVNAEMPYYDSDQLVMLVNQGPLGDYGEVKGKFVSEDEGESWEFVEEVEPDEAP